MRPIFLLLLAAASALAETPPQIAGCAVFPADNAWNVPVDTLPVAPFSATLVNTIGATTGLHPDFGTTYEGAPNGIPYVVVPGTQAKVAVQFVSYASESDPGPYPIPPDAPIEGGPSSEGDRHVLVVDSKTCILYEIGNSYPQANGTWKANGGAIFDLKSNRLRPAGWTSADAAGLPIFPGLVRYEEVAAGEIRHAIRFTVKQTRKAYVWPATHYASSLTDAKYPRMGERFRLRAGFDTSGYPPQAQVILRALKKYGIILADNGSNWYLSGAPNSQWDDNALGTLRNVKGSDFEAVDASGLMAAPGSGKVRPLVNASNYRPGAVAPGEAISIFGSNLGPDQGVGYALNSDGNVNTSLGGTSVLFDGTPAPMLYSQSGQLNAVVPYAVAQKQGTLVEVDYNGGKPFSATVEVHSAAPGIFTFSSSGSGQAAALNEDYSINSPATPADRGHYIWIYATGEGQTDPAGVDGKVAGTQPPAAANFAQRVSMRIGGQAAQVDYAGGVQSLVAGVLEVKAKIPAAVTPGNAAPVLLTIDGRNSQQEVTIAVR